MDAWATDNINAITQNRSKLSEFVFGYTVTFDVDGIKLAWISSVNDYFVIAMICAELAWILTMVAWVIQTNSNEHRGLTEASINRLAAAHQLNTRNKENTHCLVLVGYLQATPWCISQMGECLIRASQARQALMSRAQPWRLVVSPPPQYWQAVCSIH